MTAGAGLPPVAQAGEPAPVIPQAGPAYADTTLPLPPFPGRTLPEAAAESTCTSLICQMDPGTDLVLLTLYVMLCFAVMTACSSSSSFCGRKSGRLSTGFRMLGTGDEGESAGSATGG